LLSIILLHQSGEKNGRTQLFAFFSPFLQLSIIMSNALSSHLLIPLFSFQVIGFCLAENEEFRRRGFAGSNNRLIRFFHNRLIHFFTSPILNFFAEPYFSKLATFHSREEAGLLFGVTRDRCYDHNFLRFSQIFCEKIGVFLKNQCYDQNFAYFSFVLSQKRQFFRRIFRRKYLKNHNIGPR
jgi:hypothetical protein